MAAGPPAQIEGGEQRVRNWLEKYHQEEGRLMDSMLHFDSVY